jgi:hypothetical protein
VSRASVRRISKRFDLLNPYSIEGLHASTCSASYNFEVAGLALYTLAEERRRYVLPSL